MAPSPASRIPPEVITIILKSSLAALPNPAKYYMTGRYSLQTSKNFRFYFAGYALISKAWLDPVRELLYEAVDLTCRKPVGLRKLVWSLCERDLGRFVKDLDITDRAKGVEEDEGEGGVHFKGRHEDLVRRVIPSCPYVKSLSLSISGQDYRHDPDPDGEIWRTLIKLGLKGEDGELYEGAGLDSVYIHTPFAWPAELPTDTQDDRTTKSSWMSVLRSPGWRTVKYFLFGLGAGKGAFRGFDPAHYSPMSDTDLEKYDQGRGEREYEVRELGSLDYSKYIGVVDNRFLPRLPPGADSKLTFISFYESSVSPQLLLDFISTCGRNLTSFYYIRPWGSPDDTSADLRFPQHLISEFPQFARDHRGIRLDSSTAAGGDTTRGVGFRKCYLMDSIALICRSLEHVEVEECLPDALFDPDRKLLSRFGPNLRRLTTEGYRIQIGPGKADKSGGLAEELMRRGRKRGGRFESLHLSDVEEEEDDDWYGVRRDQEEIQTGEVEGVTGEQDLPENVKVWRDAIKAAKEAGVDLSFDNKRY